jgi:hypothetical protein
VFDTAKLLMISTSVTETAQPLQNVSPDCAVETTRLLIFESEKLPMKMLVVPPYTCKKAWHQRALHSQWQYHQGCADSKALTLEPYD